MQDLGRYIFVRGIPGWSEQSPCAVLSQKNNPSLLYQRIIRVTLVVAHKSPGDHAFVP